MKRWHLLILASLCLGVAGLRLKTYYEPLERDITTYAVAAHELANGKILYSEPWDIKPPLIYWTYLLAEFFFGYGELQIYMLNLIGTCCLIVGIYFLASRLLINAFAGIMSAFILTIISGDLTLQGNQPNTELFINASLVWAIYFFLSPIKSKRAFFFYSILSGVLFGLATLYKQVAIVPALFIYFCYLLIENFFPFLKRLFYCIVSITIIFILWLAVGIYFYLQGTFEDFFYTNFIFSRYYAFETNNSEITFFGKLAFLIKNSYYLFVVPLKTILPLVIFALFGIFVGLLNKKASSIYCAVYLVSSLIMLVLPWKFFPHYYQLLVPSICIAGTNAILELAKFGKVFLHMKRKKIQFLLATFIVITLGLVQFPDYYFRTADSWSQKKYGMVFCNTKLIGKEIMMITNENEKIFQWGHDTGIYFYSRRRPASGRFFASAFLYGTKKDEYTNRTLEEFKKNPPALVILPSAYSSDNPVIKWILENYQAIGNHKERAEMERKMWGNEKILFHLDRPIAPQYPPIPAMYFFRKKSTNN